MSIKCQKARKPILSVSVKKSESYGIFGEPGASAEWGLVFTVAGQQELKRIDGVRDGSVLGINRKGASCMLRMFQVFVATALLTICYNPLSAQAQGAGPGRVILFEGNNCTQDIVGRLDAVSQSHNFQNDRVGLENDEVRSLMLVNISAPLTVRLFDSPIGSRLDDWVEIGVSAFGGSYCINSLEDPGYRTTTNGHWADPYIDYGTHNGLDGKVSYIQITRR